MSMTLRIDNLHCEECARRVRRALDGVPGVEAVGAIDVEAGTLEISADEATLSRDDLRGMLQDAGYPLRGLEDGDSRDFADASDAGRARTGSDLRCAGAPTEGGEGRSGAPAERGGPPEILSFGLVALLALGAGLLGYAAYEVYPRFGMPAVDGLALLFLAVGAGVASFFSPCAFPLLLAVVGREAGRRGEDGPTAVRPMHFAGAVSLGATAFVLLVGAVIVLGGRALVGEVVFTSVQGRILRATVGLFLVSMGLVQWGLLPNPLHAVERVVRPMARFQAVQRRKRPVVGAILFGFGYLLAGFG